MRDVERLGIGENTRARFEHDVDGDKMVAVTTDRHRRSIDTWRTFRLKARC